MTDTARFADVLLPATTFLEGYEIARGYGPISLQLAKPVVEAQGEARSNADVFGELMDRLDAAVRRGSERRTRGNARRPGEAAASRSVQTCAIVARRRRHTTGGRFSSTTCGR